MTLKNFVNKRHAQHAGWVLGVLCNAGLDATPCKIDGDFSAKIYVSTEDGDFFIDVPPPPDWWDLPRMI